MAALGLGDDVGHAPGSAAPSTSATCCSCSKPSASGASATGSATSRPTNCGGPTNATASSATSRRRFPLLRAVPTWSIPTTGSASPPPWSGPRRRPPYQVEYRSSGPMAKSAISQPRPHLPRRPGRTCGPAAPLRTSPTASRSKGIPPQHAYLKAVLGHMPQGISVFDENLKLRVWNRGFVEVLDLPGSRFNDGVAFEDLILAFRPVAANTAPATLRNTSPASAPWPANSNLTASNEAGLQAAATWSLVSPLSRRADRRLHHHLYRHHRTPCRREALRTQRDLPDRGGEHPERPHPGSTSQQRVEFHNARFRSSSTSRTSCSPTRSSIRSALPP